MGRKKKNVTELKYYETPEWQQHSKMTVKLKKAKIPSGPEIAYATGTTLTEYLPEVEKLKEELFAETEDITHCPICTKTKVIAIALLLAFVVYYIIN